MDNKIPFNKPYLTGKEAHYLYQAVYSGHISGNGLYTKKCQQFFVDNFSIRKCLLTTSCTDALEMSAMLLDIKPGDEVIMPTFTFVSTALAFIRQGAKIVFVDSREDHPGMDEESIEQLITSKTKVIVVVHYAGVSCDMDRIMNMASKNNLYVVEDAAQCIDSYFKNTPLGSIGNFGCFSFHETKNVQCGEGGLLAVNDSNFEKRAEIIWEKGTNRSEFFRGEVNKYGWVDIGSSFLPSDLLAAFLYAQLENLNTIQIRRKAIWQKYMTSLESLAKNGFFTLPKIPEYASNNAHMFYLVFNKPEERDNFMQFLKGNGIMSVIHYQSLHKSKYYEPFSDSRKLFWSDHYSDCLVRLPLFYELTEELQEFVIETIYRFYNQ
jgi:dTDP-4-amino-4,6-dideoxygalactose transaminase